MLRMFAAFSPPCYITLSACADGHDEHQAWKVSLLIIILLVITVGESHGTARVLRVMSLSAIAMLSNKSQRV